MCYFHVFQSCINNLHTDVIWAFEILDLRNQDVWQICVWFLQTEEPAANILVNEKMANSQARHR